MKTPHLLIVHLGLVWALALGCSSSNDASVDGSQPDRATVDSQSAAEGPSPEAGKATDTQGAGTDARPDVQYGAALPDASASPDLSSGGTADSGAASGPDSRMTARDSGGDSTAASSDSGKDSVSASADLGRDSTPASADRTAAVLGEIPPDQLNAALANKDFLLIDVHTPYAGTIPKTDLRIPYTDIDGLVAAIGTDLGRKVVLTCLSGHMSTTAGNALLARGYYHVNELAGGMNAWTSAGYKLEFTDAGSP